jgi:hypothetical protein
MEGKPVSYIVVGGHTGSRLWLRERKEGGRMDNNKVKPT